MEISDFAEEMTTPIHDFLVKNSESHTIRCYMPGHKGTEDRLILPKSTEQTAFTTPTQTAERA